jgi:predicted ATP-grasp superfamily ATP-dependent carboligase
MLASGDRAMSFLSRCRTELEPLLDHDLAPADVIDTCLDKDRFGPEATRLGLPVPRTFAPENIAAARRLLPSLAYPVFVKPVDRAEWDQLPAGTVDQVKGQRIDTASRMAALLDALDRAGASRFVIQSFVPGSDSEHMSVHAYVRRDGTALEAFTGSKLRIWPPHAGVGAQVLSKRIPEVVPVALQALRALRYTGFAILQFKRNAGSGVYELLEINCRYSTWTELPTRAGCNFPLAAYATITGQAPPHIHQREGISWLDVERDLKAMSTYRASGEWTWGAYLKSLSTVRCWAYFAWDDPLPFVRKLLRRGDS